MICNIKKHFNVTSCEYCVFQIYLDVTQTQNGVSMPIYQLKCPSADRSAKLVQLCGTNLIPEQPVFQALNWDKDQIETILKATNIRNQMEANRGLDGDLYVDLCRKTNYPYWQK